MQTNPNHNLLVSMYQNDYSYFSHEVADFILTNFNGKSLETEIIQSKSIANFDVYSNAWGCLISYHKDYYYNNETKIVGKWKTLFEKHGCDTSRDIKFELVKKNDSQKNTKYQVSINCFLALSNINQWYNLYAKNPEKFSLTKKEMHLVCCDFLEEKQNYSAYDLHKNEPCVQFIFNQLSQLSPEIQKEMGKNDDDFTSKILNSNLIKFLIKLETKEKLSSIFSPNSLKVIFRKSSLSENMTTNPFMMSDLLHISPAQDWLNACCKTKKLDESIFFTFFNKIMYQHTGFNFNEVEKMLETRGKSYDRNKKRSRSGNAGTETAKRLAYFSDEIKKIEFSELSKTIWFMTVIQSKNKELFRNSLDTVSFPERNSENKAISYFYEEYDKPVKDTQNYWEDIRKEYFMEKISQEIPPKTFTNLKVKIKI